MFTGEIIGLSQAAGRVEVLVRVEAVPDPLTVYVSREQPITPGQKVRLDAANAIHPLQE